jgi:hypothetical protein
VTSAGSPGPKKGRRRLRAAADIAAAAMIVTGAVFAGIAVSQHQHYDHALAVHAARKAEVDRAALAEARQFLAQQSGATTRREPHLAAVPAKTGQSPPTGVPLGAQGLALAADHRAVTSPARRHSPQARLRPWGPTDPGAVSEIRGLGATLVIPALRVRAPVVATGAVDGSMTIPADVHTVGWYDGADTTGGKTVSGPAPWPGQPGVSVLAGHINWVGQGPGALYYIGQLVAGDPLEVIGSNRVATFWRVSRPPITIAKADLPANIFVNTGPPKLVLVTCGGPFDSATGHYLDNVIVWAKLASR